MSETVLHIISPHVAADRAGISLRNLQRKVKTGEAPVPVKLGPGRVGFYAHEIQDWLASLPRTR